VGVRLDPLPLLTTCDPDYATMFAVVVNAAVDEHNRMHGGG
jgi:hypothetical protein